MWDAFVSGSNHVNGERLLAGSPFGVQSCCPQGKQPARCGAHFQPAVFIRNDLMTLITFEILPFSTSASKSVPECFIAPNTSLLVTDTHTRRAIVCYIGLISLCNTRERELKRLLAK